MVDALQPTLSLGGQMPGSHGNSEMIQIPNYRLSQNSQSQIELLLLQILSQLRTKRECTSALEDLQREKAHWDNLEDRQEEKIFELRKEKRQLEITLTDLQFENQQLRKGKCNVTHSYCVSMQKRIEELDKNLRQEKDNFNEMQMQLEKERDEYEIKLTNSQKEVIDRETKLQEANFKIQSLTNELQDFKSKQLYLIEEPEQDYKVLKDKIQEFFLFLGENALNINTSISKQNWKPLHIAAAYGELAIIDVLFESGADINVVDDSDTTPLMLAALRGKTQAVSFLISRNAILGAKDKYGYNALHRASYGGHADIVKILINNSGNALDTPTIFKEYPLHLAALYNHTDVVETLLKSGVPVDPLDSKSCTPLHRAAGHGNLLVVKLLVQYKANTSAQSAEGKTAVEYAQENNHLSVVEFLSEFLSLKSNMQ